MLTKTTSRNQLPPSDPEEDLLVVKCRMLGSSIRRLNDYNSHPEKFPMSCAIAQMLAIELKNLQQANVRHIVLYLIDRPEFRKQTLQPVIRELLREGKDYHRQPAANALGRIVAPEDSSTVAKLLLNNEIGDARSLLVSTYARIAKKSAIPVLHRLVDDPETRTQALKNLSILGDTTIEADLLKLAKHPDAYHRKIARDALKRVEKSKLKFNAKNTH